MKKLLKICVLLTCSIGFINHAMAWKLSNFDPTTSNSGFRKTVKQFDPTRNARLKNTFSNSSGDFYIYNKCIKSNINVKVEYVPVHNSSFLTSHYHFRKNEKNYLFKTENQYIYVTAQSVDNRNRANGLLKWKRKRINLGNSKNYTYSFTCG